MMFSNPDCTTCKNYQESMNPEGCFKEYSTTGFLGRMYIRTFGCSEYRKNGISTGTEFIENHFR